MRKLFLIFVNITSFCIVYSCSKQDDYPSPESHHLIADGTFIQEYLVARWDDSQWQSELADLKEAGMHYIVFAPTMHTIDDGINQIIFDGNLPETKMRYQADLVENCLRNAKKAGFKVFLGLNFNEKWWNRDQWNAEWFYREMKLGNQLADELTRRYKDRYKETLFGWYWVWEIDNLNHQTKERQDVLVNALNLNIDHLQKITPGMPLMLCPFVNYRVGNSADNRKMWQYIFAGTHFRKGDIFAPQDCVGAGGLELNMVDEWFRDMYEAVKTKPGLLFWSDAETFDHQFWTSATIDRFVQQIEIVKPYVSNVISFAYSHYYSPNQTKSGFHKAYIDYVKNGNISFNPLPEPIENLTIYTDSENKINLSWKEPANKENIAGYSIFRNGILVGNLQYTKNHQSIMNFQDREAISVNQYLYDVYSYSFSGRKSEKRSITFK